MTTDEIEATRPRFEEWAKITIGLCAFHRRKDGDYRDNEYHYSWLAWSEALRGVPSPADTAGGKGEGE